MDNAKLSRTKTAAPFRPAEGEGVKKTAVDARQGFRGRPVVYVLLASLALAILAYVILHLYFAT